MGLETASGGIGDLQEFGGNCLKLSGPCHNFLYGFGS